MDTPAGPGVHLHFDQKKFDFSVCFPLSLRITASPINPSDICFTTSDPRLSRLDRMRNVLSGRQAGCQRSRVHGWMCLHVDPFVDLVGSCSLHSAAFCGKMECRRGLMQVQSVRDFRRIMQASIMNDLVPGLRFPQVFFVDCPQYFATVGHTPPGQSALLLPAQRVRPFTASAVQTWAAIPR